MLPDLTPSPTPRHFWHHNQEQFRLKVRTFSGMPPEYTVQRIGFDRDARAYEAAYNRGGSSAFPCRSRPDPDAPRDLEAVERSQRRAKTATGIQGRREPLRSRCCPCDENPPSHLQPA